MDISDLSSGIGYTFWNRKLLDIALTHSSYINEHSSTAEHNERLEFLGDAVLELCVTDALYHLLPQSREGDMTRLRSRLVNTSTLAELARISGVQACLRLGYGEDSQGGRDRDPLLADAMESVIGAAYLDGGLAAARQVVEHIFRGRWPKTDGRDVIEPVRKDNKTLLQEATQRLKGDSRGLPTYFSDGVSGPEHAPIFFARVVLPDGREFKGSGSSRRAAEQLAAQAALRAIETA